MRKASQEESAQTNQISSWDDAIADMKRELIEIKARGAQIETAIRTFEANKASGHPWPGSEQNAR
ncbi:MAG: hypothetical protein ABSD98_04315 [Candidatus Korobacteraceae bacterium]